MGALVRAASAFLLLAGTALPVHAYESDQVTDRSDPPAESLDAANAHADLLLADAVRRTNALTHCGTDLDHVHQILAREIHHQMGERTYVPSRGKQPPMGFGAYAAWLETGPIDRDSHGARDDLYRAISFFTDPILATFGPASTITLAGQLVGTDKLDHFWIQGYDYFRRSRDGDDPLRAIAWGTQTERGLWGLSTTGVFSFADLAANYDGFRFYDGLLRAGSIMQLGTDGCVVQAEPFDWSVWVDWRYDEVLNPSVFRRGLATDIRAGLDREAPGFCDEGDVRSVVSEGPWVGPEHHAPATRTS